MRRFYLSARLFKVIILGNDEGHQHEHLFTCPRGAAGTLKGMQGWRVRSKMASPITPNGQSRTINLNTQSKYSKRVAFRDRTPFDPHRVRHCSSLATIADATAGLANRSVLISGSCLQIWCVKYIINRKRHTPEIACDVCFRQNHSITGSVGMLLCQPLNMALESAPGYFFYIAALELQQTKEFYIDLHGFASHGSPASISR